MHNIKSNFDKIKNILTEVLGSDFPFSGNYLRQGPKPKFTDIDVIALSLTADCLSINSESLLFNILNSEYYEDFPNLLSRRQYNDRRKFLWKYIDKTRTQLLPELNESETIYIIDSMPLEVCKIARSQRNKMGYGKNEIIPNRGFCAAQNKKYFGFKLHVVCNENGVIKSADITNASMHDVYFLQNEYDPEEIRKSTLIGDKGYISDPLKEHLLKFYEIDFQTPYRSNQKNKPPEPYKFQKKRKRIETLFSQLCEQFNIQRNFAKGFSGFKTRLLSKLSGLTILQYINKFFKNEPIGKIRYSLKN